MRIHRLDAVKAIIQVQNNLNVWLSSQSDEITQKVYQLIKNTNIGSSCILDLATDEYILRTGETIYVLDKCSELASKKDMFIFESFYDLAKELAKKLSYSDISYFKPTLEMITNSPSIISILGDYKKIIFILTSNEFTLYKNKLELLEEICSSEKDFRVSVIFELIARYYYLDDYLLELTKIIKDYENDDRLLNAVHVLLDEDALLDKEDIRDEVVDTFDYFKDYHPLAANTCVLDDSYKKVNGVFSCLELWEDKTDPTLRRELELINEEIKSMSHDDSIRILRNVRGVIRRVKGDKS